MKHLKSILWLGGALVLACGCGGGQGTTPTPTTQGGGGGGGNITGNWDFNTTSTIGMPALTIAGGINQSGSSVSGQMHVSGSSCFDQLSAIGLSGTAAADNISLTSLSFKGQSITLDGKISQHGFTGSYNIKGGCADGDQGNAIGVNVPILSNSLNGTFTSSQSSTFDMTAQVAQNDTASDDGTYGVTGTATFNRSCFSSGTMNSGKFPSGSFILGTYLAIVIGTDDGTLAFLGKVNSNRSEVDGDYSVSGGACDQSGTATLIPSSPWDY